MANDLRIGEPRHGRLDNTTVGAQDIAAVLERTAQGVVVHVTFRSADNEACDRWFHTDLFYVPQRGENESSSVPAVPSTLRFKDTIGVVELLGCTNGKRSTDFNLVTATINVTRAVLEAPEVSFAKVMGLRAEISGLRSWLGRTSIKQTDTWHENTHAVRKISVEIEAPAAIPIPNSALTLRPSFVRWRDDGTLGFRDIVEVEHKVEDAIPWREHGSKIRPLRDLLALSYWRSEGLVPVSVMRTDDGTPVSSPGQGSLHWWRKVVESDADELLPEPKRVEPFIGWHDLGPEGLDQWLKLRAKYDRAIGPGVASIYLKDAMVEARLTQVAISLEALGYLLAMEKDGWSEVQANKLNFKARVDRILAEVPTVLSFVDSGWSQRFADTYNAIKHVNRDLPAVVDVANFWREGGLLFRTWVAHELGIDHGELKKRVDNSPQRHPYELVED